VNAPVVLRGGRADGTYVKVPTTRTIHVVVVARETKTYPAGAWSPDSPAVEVDVIDFDTYRRVDAHTFEIINSPKVEALP
jgi:hypothetical protein